MLELHSWAHPCRSSALLSRLVHHYDATAPRGRLQGMLGGLRPLAAATRRTVGGALVSPALITPSRALSVRTEDFFSKEAVSHARRVSWAPHTTEKKVGAFAKLSRSNFNDPLPVSFHSEPYFEEEIEAYRAHHRPDVYVYKYNVSPTHLSLRE